MPEAESHLALNALVKAIATITSLAKPDQPTAVNRCELWVHDADDTFAPENGGAYTVFRAYGPSVAGSTPNRVAVQAFTRGKPVKTALARSAAVFNALLDDNGNGDRFPRRQWLVGEQPDQWLFDIFELTEGVQIGRDDQGRSEVVSNFELAYRRVPA